MKKKILLLLIIYLAFISLGLPDSLLGSAWPDMYIDLQVPKSYAGIIAMIIAAGTVISSLFGSSVIKRFGVAYVTTFSVLLTALALLGFSFTHQFLFLCLLAIPFGLGAGAVDVGLNNYVALHYKAIHMNWLHCFWGVGAAIGPMIMAGYLSQGKDWTNGYNTIGWIQIAIFVILFISIPLWKPKAKTPKQDTTTNKVSFKKILKISGIKQALIIFFCYCAIEVSFGLWGASYLVFSRNFEPDKAARFAALYYLGITIGRFLSGIITLKMSNKQLVYIGQSIIALGIIVLLLPFKITLLPGFLLIGLGCAPIFPSLLHETPENFGKQYSQSIIGMQMASAYVGITLMPFLFGKIASVLNYSYLLWFIALLLVLEVIMTYDLNKKVAGRER